MEIKVYPISETETLESIIGIIRQTEADRIVLFAEEKCPVLQDPVNLRLIRFYSEERQLDIVVIARDPVIRHEAEKLGLYRTDFNESSATIPEDSQLALELAAPTEDPPVSHGNFSKPNPYRLPHGGLITALIFAFFSLVLGTFLLFSPRVAVVVYPAVEDRNLTVQAMMGPTFTEKEMDKHTLPGRWIESRGQIEYSFRTTGQKTVGFRAASGQVTFYNGSDKAVVVPRGTELSSKSGALFHTRRDVLVPAKQQKKVSGIVTGENYGQADVEIEAVKKGMGGNSPRHTVTTVVGRLGKMLQVTNFRPVLGGEDRQIAVLTEEDLLQAEKEARSQMEMAAPDEVKAAIGNGYIYLPELTSIKPQPIAASHRPGDEAETVRVTLPYHVKTMTISQNTAYKYLKMRFIKELPTHLQLSGETIRIKSITARPGEKDNYQLVMQAETAVKGRLERRRLLRQLCGRETTSAHQSLAELPEVGKFNIQAPEGMKRLPRFGFQIKIILPATR